MLEKDSFYGEIWVDRIKNIYANGNGNKHENKLMDEDNIKVVHYPDCQQLIIWLPDYYSNYSTISIADLNSGQNIFQNAIAEIISGSVQIIIDSLFIRPGNFVLRIHANGGLIHEIYFNKLIEGEKAPQKIIEAPLEDEAVKEPIVYRDGLGNIIKNNDIDWREIYY